MDVAKSAFSTIMAGLLPPSSGIIRLRLHSVAAAYITSEPVKDIFWIFVWLDKA